MSRRLDPRRFELCQDLPVALLGKPGGDALRRRLPDLEYARFDGKAWKRSTVDSKNIAGQFPSLVFDTDGNPVVAYYRKTSGDLRVMRHDGTQWVRQEVDTTDNVGQFASLAISENGTLAVAYADATTGDLKYAQWTGSAWSVQTVWIAPS